MQTYGSKYPELLKAAVDRVKRYPFWKVRNEAGEDLVGPTSLAAVKGKLIQVDTTHNTAQLITREGRTADYPLENYYGVFAELIQPSQLSTYLGPTWNQVTVTKDSLQFTNSHSTASYKDLLVFLEKCVQFAKQATLAEQEEKDEKAHELPPL